MKSIKQRIRIPHNHEIRIKIPEDVPENEEVEVTVTMKETQEEFHRKLKLLEEAVKDPMYLNDCKATMDDFSEADREHWEQL